MRRWGILGGSFDPIHLGHLWIALFAREQLELERVVLVPAASPPHKSRGTVAPYAHRLEMVRRVAAARPWLEASDIESDASQPSYTVETLRRLRAAAGDGVELWLLVGSDSLADIPNWREPEEILHLAALGVYGRSGHEAALPDDARARRIDGPECGLSSTLIRERLRRGACVDGLVPPEIAQALTAERAYLERPEDA